MAGIYIHIPFCKQKCTYCDFFSKVSPKLVAPTVQSICKELEIRRDYLKKAPIETIYWGGGTPSLLEKEHFELIFKTIMRHYEVVENAEITFEANPDDLTTAFFESIDDLPFNRISIGIQSFNDNDLRRINRRHNGDEARSAVERAKKAGFDNISIDLIYGLPFQTLDGWIDQLNTAMELDVQHISVYGLTYEEGTVLWKQKEKGLVQPASEEMLLQMNAILLDKMLQKGFERYEISNFSLPGYRSRHNSSYWNQIPYLGIGPSAHSYDGDSRQWNFTSIAGYNEALNQHGIFYECEELSINDKYNDLIMTSLRTSDGLDLQKIEDQFGLEFKAHCLQQAQSFIKQQKIQIVGDRLRLTSEGFLLTDLILVELMRV